MDIEEAFWINFQKASLRENETTNPREAKPYKNTTPDFIFSNLQVAKKKVTLFCLISELLRASKVLAESLTLADESARFWRNKFQSLKQEKTTRGKKFISSQKTNSVSRQDRGRRFSSSPVCYHLFSMDKE